MADGQHAPLEGQETLPAIPAVQLPPLPAAATPFDLLARALERGDDLTVLEKLMDLQERHEGKLARKAFDEAISAAKAEIKPVSRNRLGNNDKKYADLAAYAKEVDPILAKHHLSYRYRSKQEGAIHITCVLSHRDGHFEETTLSGAADTTGNKNAIQAIGSTVEYLKRYTLTLALGLSSANDDDGKAAGGDMPINEEQTKELRRLIEASGADIEKFCEYFKIEAVPDLSAKDFPRALAFMAEKLKLKKKQQGGAK